MDALKAEFKKLLTVRSTYFILLIVFIIVAFFSFYISGWRINGIDLHGPLTLSSDITGAIRFVSIFGGLSAIFLITHEYRYNTIMYSLTSVNNRSKILISKIIVITIYALLFTLFFATLSPLLSLWAIHLHHLSLAPQTIYYKSLFLHVLFYGWGYIMAGAVLAALIRNQVAALITFLVAPGTIEALLYLWIKNDVVYLPFTALQVVLMGHPDQGVTVGISQFHAILVFISYLVAAWIVSWVLFLRRDAN
jgi:ABC-type transport system involved in multi-copper enzyme maturation permease subunit